MKVLHIINDFAGSKVHANLVKEMDEIGIEQIVYTPIRNQFYYGKNKFESNNVTFIYSLCIYSWYKFVYHYKVYKLYKDLKKNINLNQIDFIHAHTLFSDGALAYEAFKEYGIKYAVAVRNTDLNGFIRVMKHTYHRGRSILLNAEKIYFISAAIMRNFSESTFVRPILNEVKDKFVLRPNGIDDYWHNNISTEIRKGHDLLYIGVFDSNKNVARLAEAIVRLREEKEFNKLRLILVGGNAKGDNRSTDVKLQKMMDEHSDFIINKGRIIEKDMLKVIMESCSLFVMPSIHETFGLVYLEALSQNLPVIYTRGQGIDGLFDESIGIGVNPLSIDEIKDAVKIILTNRLKYNNHSVNFEKFKWRRIANDYIQDYIKIVSQ